MADSPVSAIKKLVDDATEEQDDHELRFKLRTASQLLDVVQEHTDDLSVILENGNFDDDIEKKLQDLGYIKPPAQSK